VPPAVSDHSTSLKTEVKNEMPQDKLQSTSTRSIKEEDLTEAVPIADGNAVRNCPNGHTLVAELLRLVHRTSP